MIPRRRGRRSLLLPGALLATALLAGACSSHRAARPGQPDTTEAPRQIACPQHGLDDVTTPVEVTVWHGGGPATLGRLDQVVTTFNSTQQRVHVTVQPQTGTAGELRQHLVTAVAGHNAPDLAVVDDVEAQALIDSGAVLPASTCGKQDGSDGAEGSGPATFLPVTKGYYSSASAAFAGSAEQSTLVLVFNRARFLRAGLDPDKPPLTLTELQKAARALHVADPSVKPLRLPLTSRLVENWLTGAGSEIVNHANGRDERASASTFDNPRTLVLYQWLHDMQAEGLLEAVLPDGTTAPTTPTSSSTSTSTSTTTPAVTTPPTPVQPAAVAGGAIAGTMGSSPMAIGLSDDLDALSREAAPTRTAPVDGSTTTTTSGGAAATPAPVSGIDIDIAPLPGLDAPGKGQVGGAAWFVPVGTAPEVQAGAWEFLSYLNAVPTQVLRNLRDGYLPFNTRAVNDPSLTKVWSDSRIGRWLDTAYTQLTNFDPQFPGPAIGPYDETRDAIGKSVEAVVLQGADATEAITAADHAIDQAVKRYAADHP